MLTKSKKEVKNIKPFRKIELLNLPEKTTGAYISVFAKGNLLWSEEDDSEFYSEYIIKISDCVGSVSLHGCLSSVESRKNALAKIDTLIDVLTSFKSHLVSEFDENKVKY